MDKITVETTIKQPVEKVWEAFTNPDHVTKWNNAEDSWHTPRAENDLRVGGKFNFRMEARDGSSGFDFIGIYDEVEPNKRIAYTMEDGRKVEVNFEEIGGETRLVESFDPETENTPELQRAGWQAILDNLKKYTESLV